MDSKPWRLLDIQQILIVYAPNEKTEELLIHKLPIFLFDTFLINFLIFS